jgi:heptosyltransferase III
MEPAERLGNGRSTRSDAGNGSATLIIGCRAHSTKVLVLRGGALGDLILTLPTLRELRKGYPGAYVQLLGVFPQARLAAPEVVDAVGRVDSPSVAPIFTEGPLPAALSEQLGQFDIAVNLFDDPGLVMSRNLTAAGVKSVIGRPRISPPEKHVVYQLAAALGPLGLALSDPVPSLEIERPLARSPQLAVHIGSGSPQKNWPLDHWIELIGRLEHLFREILLVGGEADFVLVREFLARSRFRNLKTLLGLNLNDLKGALNACTLYIGHDTGVSHLAAAVKVPTVVLFGPTNARVWAPLGEHVTVIAASDGKMESIRVEDVEAQVEGIFEQRNPRNQNSGEVRTRREARSGCLKSGSSIFLSDRRRSRHTRDS